MKKYCFLFFLLFCCLGINFSEASCCQIFENFNNCQKTERSCGPYAKFVGGVSFFDLKRIKADPGFYVGGSLGFPLFYHFKIEAEVMYYHTCIKAIKEQGLKLHHLGGHLHAVSYMANLVYDFDLPCVVQPFVGVGVGYIQSHEQWIYHRTVRHSHFYFEDIHKHQSKPDGFAWQVMTGIVYPFCDHLEVGLDYQFLKEKRGSIHKLGLSLAYVF